MMYSIKPSAHVKSNSAGKLEQAVVVSKRAIVRQPINTLGVQNLILVWLDSTTDPGCSDCQNTIAQLRHVVNNIKTYSDSDQCIQFLQTITDNKVCLIVSGALGQHIVPCVHEMTQVDSIFIYCSNKKLHERWAKQWLKIRGVFTQMPSVCEALKLVVQQCEQNSIPISFVATNAGDVSTISLDRLDPSYVFAQILKEIIFTINSEEKNLTEFLNNCREAFSGNERELRNIDKLKRHYRDESPIWWYTQRSFLYPMLNRAMRLMDMELLTQMGFFIADLHRDLQRLHSRQYASHHFGNTFTVYRGQGLSKADFEQMTNTKYGLISFNSFLSTSKNIQTSLRHTHYAAKNPDLMAVLFVMTIEPTQSITPFANITDVCYSHAQDEVLFSIHAVFRIHDIKPMNGNSRIYEVNLALTINDNDKDLQALNDRVREETFVHEEGWYRMGIVLSNIHQLDEAEKLYAILLGQTTRENDKVSIYHELGKIKYNQGEYKEAVAFHEKALEIKQRILPPNHPDFAYFYNNIGLVYKNVGNYTSALLFYKKALDIQKRAVSVHHSDLCTSYSNIGNVYDSMEDYPKALSSHEKALEIRKQTLPPNHPDLASSYNSIGLVYDKMDDYMKALSFHEKSLDIRQQTLPSNHPDVASSYNNIGNVYNNMGDYLKALSSYEKSLESLQKSLPLNHADLSMSYYNIGLVYQNMNNYSIACSFYEHAVEIGLHSLTQDHPHLLLYRNSLEDVRKKL